jgi:hypothetical protein
VGKGHSNKNSEILTRIAPSAYLDIKESLRWLYLEDNRPWLVGFSGGKDSTMLASLVFDAVLSIPAEQRKKPVSVLCIDTRVEIPAIVEMVDGTLAKMHKCSQHNSLNIDVNLLKPPPEQSFWVNIIGRGYPPPNHTFRFGCWTCTVVERDKASEGLLASGDERMERLIEFRETLLFCRNPADGKRDMKRINGNDGPGPLQIDPSSVFDKRASKVQVEKATNTLLKLPRILRHGLIHGN